ncbi:MAG: penicillin-binding protein 2 [Sphingomonadaceae bacterium]|nr:penicillin-binding protein 2 [Sphingomonadaceae bacterium]
MTALAISTTVSSSRHRLVNVRRQSLVTAKLRALYILALFAFIALCAVFRVVFLGLFAQSASSYDLADPLVPDRGEIVDRNGELLAREFSAYALWFKPDELKDGSPLVRSSSEIATELVRIFPDLDYEKTMAKLASQRGVHLRVRILPEQANKVHALGEPALQVPFERDRIYPQGSLAAHVLGFVESDEKGRVGMEAYFDQRLTGERSRGQPAVLSIDVRVQGALEDGLLWGMGMSKAKGAAGIVLDVDTGEVLALASLPAFNPNKVLRADKIVDTQLAKQGETANVFNRVTNQVYELGSTFKPITVAAALDAGTITSLGKRYQASRPLVVDGYPIRDSHVMGPSLNVPQSLIYSSNIVIAQIADELGSDRLKSAMEALGMNERPYIEVPARGMPVWPKEWGRLKNMTVSYGHGIAVTPMHLASAYAALVNGGVWRPATLRKLEPHEAPAGRRVFTAATSARMRQMLRMIVTYGTGSRADARGFRVGGKTGSAEKPGVGGYRRNSLVSTFAAAFPMDRPRYVVIAMLDEPQGTAATHGQRTASWNAAPVVGRVVPRIGPLLGIKPDETRDVDISDLRPLIGKGAER